MVEVNKSFRETYLADALSTFRAYKRLAERSLDQVTDAEFFEVSGSEANSIAVVVKHIAGNQRSRWTNFLTEDGEKPDRDRDSEFEIAEPDRQELMKSWEFGWKTLLDALSALSPDDLFRTVTIRGEPHSVVQAINRQLTHYAYHIGQIVLLAKQFRDGEWKSLSVPRNRSRQFNEFLKQKASEGVAPSHPLEGTLEFSSGRSENS